MRTKFLLLSIFVPFALLACNRTEKQSKTDEVAITLTPTFDPAASRVTATAFEEGDQIGLYAVMVGRKLEATGNRIDNAKFIAASGGVVVPSPEIYYPDAKSTIALFAYYPYNSSVSDATKLPFAVTTDQKASDLCYASAEVMPSQEAQTLPFKHLLSRVVLNITLNSRVESVTSVKFINTATDFTIDLSTGIITLGTQSGTLAVNQLSVSNFEAIVAPQTFAAEKQMLEIMVEATTGDAEIYYYTPLADIILEQGKVSTFSLTLSDNQRVTLNGSQEVVPWTDGANTGTLEQRVSNNFTAHSMIAHYRFSDINRVVLDVKNGLTGAVTDFEATNFALVDGSSLGMASYTFDFAPLDLNYPYTIQSVKLYKADELIQEASTAGSAITGSNVYKSGAFTLALKFLPAISLSPSAPDATIPRAGATYYTHLTSNTAWSAVATNATVIESAGVGDVTSYAITVDATLINTTRPVSVVFTTTLDDIHPVATATWSGTQDANAPPGCFSIPLPGFSGVYVALVDNAISHINAANANCAAWGGRLPTKNELVAMRDYQSYYAPFPDARNYYWSSTPYGSGYWYLVNFNPGDVAYNINPVANYAVRCVRGW